MCISCLFVAKALAPKKKVVELFSSALSDAGDNNNAIISVLNVTTFQWSFLNIDCIPYDLDSPSPMLNLTGHSAMENPLNVREILIFGGRAVENGNTHYADYVGMEDDASFVAANLFTLNIDECTLKQIEVKNEPDDTVNVPEARLNHICQRNIEGHIVLNYNREEAKSKKVKNGRRVFDITAKKKQIVSQPVTLVYGGFKANSPGFCDCSVHELFFVPNPNKKKKDDSEIKFAASEENSTSNSVGNKDDASHVSKLSLETFDFDDRSSVERPLRSLYESDSRSGSAAGLRALKLKPDCSTQLLSPKRGVDGHYFDLKSSLSHSKSTFIPSSSKVLKSPESDPPPHPSSSMDPLAHKGSGSPAGAGAGAGGGGEDDEVSVGGESASAASSASSALSAQRMLFMSAREIMRTRTHEIAPKTKGMTVHNARSVYNRLYPLPGLPNSLKKKARNLK
jgi:hypothetical protein